MFQVLGCWEILGAFGSSCINRYSVLRVSGFYKQTPGMQLRPSYPALSACTFHWKKSHAPKIKSEPRASNLCWIGNKCFTVESKNHPLCVCPRGWVRVDFSTELTSTTGRSKGSISRPGKAVLSLIHQPSPQSPYRLAEYCKMASFQCILSVMSEIASYFSISLLGLSSTLWLFRGIFNLYFFFFLQFFSHSS